MVMIKREVFPQGKIEVELVKVEEYVAKNGDKLLKLTLKALKEGEVKSFRIPEFLNDKFITAVAGEEYAEIETEDFQGAVFMVEIRKNRNYLNVVNFISCDDINEEFEDEIDDLDGEDDEEEEDVDDDDDLDDNDDEQQVEENKFLKRKIGRGCYR